MKNRLQSHLIPESKVSKVSHGQLQQLHGTFFLSCLNPCFMDSLWQWGQQSLFAVFHYFCSSFPGSSLNHPSFLPSSLAPLASRHHQDPYAEEGPPALIQSHSLHPPCVQAFPLRSLNRTSPAACLQVFPPWPTALFISSSYLRPQLRCQCLCLSVCFLSPV